MLLIKKKILIDLMMASYYNKIEILKLKKIYSN